MKNGNDGFVHDVLGTAGLVAVDVGARGDIPEPWLSLDGHARILAFEPDEGECARLRTTYDARGHGELYRILPVALSGTGGRRSLYVTNTPSGASLLHQDTALNREYVDHGYLFPISERQVETRTLASVLDEIGEPRVDMMKIDVEGAALEVLEGLGEARLDALLQVELETSITQQFRDERTLFDIHGFMLRKGFELYDMRRMYARLTRDGRADGYQKEVFGVHAESPTISGRLLDVDAIYFRKPTLVLATKSEAIVRRHAVAFATYGFFCEAYALFERAEREGIMRANAARCAREGIVAWHGHRSVRRAFHRPTPFWGLVRQATKMVGMSDQVADRLAHGEAREVVRRIVARARDAFRQ